AAAVEHHGCYPGGLGALGDELAHRHGRGLVGAGLDVALETLVQTRSGGERAALEVVDHLGVDVLRGAEHGKPRLATRRPGEAVAHARLAPGKEICDFSAHRRIPTSSCLLCAGPSRWNSGCPCPYRVPACGRRESPPRLGRRAAYPDR